MASFAVSSVTDSFLDEIEENYTDILGAVRTPVIYGREKETALLLQTYERVAQTRQSLTVLVHGLSGHGKTALIENFRELVFAAEGLFCGAKYFQNTGFQEPHSAIMAAFSDLCDLMIQSSALTEERRHQIQINLESEGAILRKVISNISPFLDDGLVHVDEDIKSDARITLFRVACRNFLRAIASCIQPIVIFLDDIQWMDDGSKKLIEMYVSDCELQNVMFILSYRDEEKECVQSIFSKVSEESFVDIPLKKLTIDGVAAMVAKIMRRSDQNDTSDESTQRKELVNLIYQRTNGNPFHVIQFMDTIELEGYLKFDPDSKSWAFDVQEIQRDVMVAADVADLLLRKIQLLPQDEQETLKVASLMGYDFDESILFQVIREERDYRNADKSLSTSTSRSVSLGKAHDMGLVERVGSVSNFPHDKIQSAFRSMISEDEEIQLQRIIGETYLSLTNVDSFYRAALHLNETVRVIQLPEDRVRLARINLQASTYASDRSAFDTAADFLRQSLDIIDTEALDKWSKNFDLAFEITENLARVELIVGNLDRCKELTEEALIRATTLDAKIKSLLNAVECQLAGDDLIRTAVRALATLGVKFPPKICKHHVAWKFLTVRKLLRGKRDEDILKLAPMKDKAKKTASRILMNLCLHAAQQYERLTYIYAALVAFELTLHYGLSAHSPTYIMIFGMAELHLNNLEGANRFASLGKKLLDQMQSKTTECSAYFLWGTLLAHWSEPLVNLRAPIEKGVESGFQTGDIMFTPIAMGSMFALRLIIGYNLQDLEGFMRIHYNRLCDLSQEAMLLWVQPCFQAVLNMQSESSEWNELATLSGEIMNEEVYFRKTVHLKNHLVAATALTFKAWVAYHFGFVDIAVSAYERMENLPPYTFDTYAAIERYFLSSLTYYDHFRQTGKGKHFRKARKWQRCLDRIQAKGSPNARHATLLRAEEKCFEKKMNVDSLRTIYESAIAAMVDAGCGMQYIALAYERVGFMLIEKEMHAEAREYFDQALKLYHGWGAFAKCDWLQASLSAIQSPPELAPKLRPPQVVGRIPRPERKTA